MPATPWAELSGTQTSWSQAIGSTGVADDFFVDFLFDLTALVIPGATSYTELSISATPSTELTGVLTSYTELTL